MASLIFSPQFLPAMALHGRMDEGEVDFIPRAEGGWRKYFGSLGGDLPVNHADLGGKDRSQAREFVVGRWMELLRSWPHMAVKQHTQACTAVTGSAGPARQSQRGRSAWCLCGLRKGAKVRWAEAQGRCRPNLPFILFFQFPIFCFPISFLFQISIIQIKFKFQTELQIQK
jgi:hypothetical protein